MTPRVRMLLAANIGVFFMQVTMPAVAPAVVDALVFVPRLILTRPWTIVTYMFLHGGLMHILFNMLVLYFFGPRVEARMGSGRFTILYFLSGISGALVSLALAPSSPIIGASAGVFGVMLAFAHFWPHEPIYIWGILPIPARVLVILTTVFSLWMGLGGSDRGVADFAHLGGYAGAFLYVRWLDRARGSFRRRAVDGVKLPPALRTPRPKIDLTTVHALNRDEVNRLLDKISEHGVDSLTPQERMFLSNFAPPDDRMPPPS